MLNKDRAAVASSELKGETWASFPGFVLRRVVDPESGGSDHFRMSLVTLEPGKGTPRHVHRHSDEAWYVVSGRGLFYGDGKKTTFGPGHFIFVRKNIVHQLVNTGRETLTYVAVTAPPCDFKNDNDVVEEFDPAAHAAL